MIKNRFPTYLRSYIIRRIFDSVFIGSRRSYLISNIPVSPPDPLYSRGIVDETAEGAVKLFPGHFEIRHVYGVPPLFGQHDVHHLITEHRHAQHRQSVVSGLDDAVYAAVRDEQFAVGVPW